MKQTLAAMISDEFIARAALRNPLNEAIAGSCPASGLPNAWIISDDDVFYFDPDASWQAADATTREAQTRLTHFKTVEDTVARTRGVACIHVLTNAIAPPRT
ncbi:MULTISPECIES: hypothetical protein [unclassified Nitrobacter]|uniref:hypothetical protein n=1 Tax=unclassified Nitrobacter TaxID=2620411 RepID=UPI001AD24300|nr:MULTISPECIES: hypothetical protein [unclassified Nitrobacter]MBN9149573.1 hypothetical protein [Nitrobacter sp.]